MNTAPLLPAKVSNSRNHQFDFLRILFATLVILAHAPELTDGSNKRELFARFTNSHVSFGALAVDGFFLLSGFLIVKSWQNRPVFSDFMKKRFLRILPGYFVAAVLSVVVVGWLTGGNGFFKHLSSHSLRSILVISSPSTPDVLPGFIKPFAVVNGSLWTIQYELRCYVLVALFGMCGLFRRKSIWLTATVIFLVAMASPLKYICDWNTRLYPLLGDPSQIFRLTAVYLVGDCFYIYRDHIKFRLDLTLAALIGLVMVRFLQPSQMEIALTLFGGYLMFYFGQMHVTWLAWMKNVPDISYGIYVYGYPVLSLWIWYRHGSPWVAFAAATPICFVLGWLSWTYIEGPALSLKGKSEAKATTPCPTPQSSTETTLASLPAN